MRRAVPQPCHCKEEEETETKKKNRGKTIEAAEAPLSEAKRCQICTCGGHSACGAEAEKSTGQQQQLNMGRANAGRRQP